MPAKINTGFKFTKMASQCKTIWLDGIIVVFFLFFDAIAPSKELEYHFFSE